MSKLDELKKQHPNVRMEAIEVIGQDDNVLETVVIRAPSLSTIRWTVENSDKEGVELLKLCLLHPSVERFNQIIEDSPQVLSDGMMLIKELSESSTRRVSAKKNSG